jgi:NADPH:quinone reductase-like Zn-dependent oxidoreductase
MGTRNDWEQLNRLLGAGRLKPVVDCTFPLAEAAAAQERMEKADQFGKIVLTIPPLE